MIIHLNDLLNYVYRHFYLKKFRLVRKLLTFSFFFNKFQVEKKLFPLYILTLHFTRSLALRETV